ncbi:MAG: hypothetical protein ACI88G_000283 [Woeseiaceae bacterium]|jgi:hypothetical protein
MFRRSKSLTLLFVTVAAGSLLAADIQRIEANNGNLIMEDIPPIPAGIVEGLNRFQNVRSASFRDWTADGSGMYVSTRFGDVSQIHRVDRAGGARQQITFYNEPVGGVSRQPGGSKVIFTRDAGGSEFTQIFQLDPVDGVTTMVTDGESRKENRDIYQQATVLFLQEHLTGSD